MSSQWLWDRRRTLPRSFTARRGHACTSHVQRHNAWTWATARYCRSSRSRLVVLVEAHRAPCAGAISCRGYRCRWSQVVVRHRRSSSAFCWGKRTSCPCGGPPTSDVPWSPTIGGRIPTLPPARTPFWSPPLASRRSSSPLDEPCASQLLPLCYASAWTLIWALWLGVLAAYPPDSASCC